MTMGSNDWVFVPEIASKTGEHEETIREKCRNGDLMGAEKVKGRWAVREHELARYLARRDHRRRGVAEPPPVPGGYGNAGRKAMVDAAAAYHGWTDEQRAAELQRLIDRDTREELAARVRREMRDDGVFRQFEDLDEEARFEAEARELAKRIRREERLRERALEILEGEDEK